MQKRTEDRRVQRTLELLRNALLGLMKEKGFESLTIQEIIDRANVGRSTFYSHFTDKDDLLLHGLELLTGSLEEKQRAALERDDGTDERLFAFSKPFFEHVNDHRDVFRVMVGKHSGALVQQHFQRMLAKLVRTDVRARAKRTAPSPAAAEALVHFVAGGIYALLAWWMTEKSRITVDQIDELFRQLAIPVTRAVLGAR